MNNPLIKGLRDALEISPDNFPLRLHLAEVLLEAGDFSQAEIEYQHVLETDKSPNHELDLARAYFGQGKYLECNTLFQKLEKNIETDFEYLIMFSRSLLKSKSMVQAMEIYGKALTMRPGFHDAELDSELRLASSFESVTFGETVDERFIQKPNMTFVDVGGMDDIKKEIELKIIKPLIHPELYKAYGKKAGGGILLYGPPGCGKTYLARATAGQVNARFISIELNDILDMWIGNSEKNLHNLFEIARKNRPCVVFIDEIDALGASRSDMKHSSGRHLINQFLQELDGVESDNEGVLVIGATNAPWNLDSAFRRPGRFDRIIFVSPPDVAARESILRLKLTKKPIENIDFLSLAHSLEKFSGADIEAVIDRAIEEKLSQAFVDGAIKPLTTKDLENAIKKHKPSTEEWFSSAKNFALFANEAGQYDDVLQYLKIKK